MGKAADKSPALYAYDAALRAEAPLLCGVDEAGRGPLCGPLAVAAVILHPGRPVAGLDDSKKLGEARREALYESIIDASIAWNVELVQPAEIDRINILQATLAGMARAVGGLTVAPDFVLVDGNKPPSLSQTCRCIVKGDGLSASIAAASILAKVTRDRFMRQLDAEYPQYKLAKHKGYGTKLHYEMLELHGVQPFYRQSFLKSFYARQHVEEG